MSDPIERWMDATLAIQGTELPAEERALMRLVHDAYARPARSIPPSCWTQRSSGSPATR